MAYINLEHKKKLKKKDPNVVNRISYKMILKQGNTLAAMQNSHIKLKKEKTFSFHTIISFTSVVKYIDNFVHNNCLIKFSTSPDPIYPKHQSANAHLGLPSELSGEILQ